VYDAGSLNLSILGGLFLGNFYGSTAGRRTSLSLNGDIAQLQISHWVVQFYRSANINFKKFLTLQEVVLFWAHLSSQNMHADDIGITHRSHILRFTHSFLPSLLSPSISEKPNTAFEDE
jgi:hypothetical protein